MAQSVKGAKVLKIKEVTHISEKFRYKEVLLELPDEKYPQPVMFRIVNEKIDEFERLNERDVIDISFNIRGRVWTNKEGNDQYFTNLDIWSLEVITPAPVDEETSEFPF